MSSSDPCIASPAITLIVIRHSPYGTSLAKAALDTTLATAAFDRPVKLLFMGDGVLQLPTGQEPPAGVKNIAKQLASLPLYDIDTVYADREAIKTFKVDLDALPLPVECVDEKHMQQMLADARHLLGF